VDALFWAIPAALALAYLAVRHPWRAETLLNASVALWIAAIVIVIARS